MTTVFTWITTRDAEHILYVVIGRYVFLVLNDGVYADVRPSEAEARKCALRMMQEDEQGGFTLSGLVCAYETDIEPYEVYEMSGPKATTWLRRLAADAATHGKALV